MAAVAATLGSRIFVIGGTAGKTTSQKTVEVYSPGTDSWETKKGLPIATGDAFVGVVADKSLANVTIIVGGGGSSLSGIFAHTHRYDANSDDWITGMPFPFRVLARVVPLRRRVCSQCHARWGTLRLSLSGPARHASLRRRRRYRSLLPNNRCEEHLAVLAAGGHLDDGCVAS